MVLISWPVSVLRILIVLSQLHETINFWFGEKVTELSYSLWPARARISCPLSKPQIFTVLSLPQETMYFWSGVIATWLI